jgi:RND family efflux transporter MFP subunit
MNYLILNRFLMVAIVTSVFLGCEGDTTDSEKESTNIRSASSSSGITSVQTYQVLAYTKLPFEEVIELPGAEVRGFETTPLMAKLGGYVKSIGTVDGKEIDIGSEVLEGTVLATLDIPEMADEITEKQAMVKQATSKVVQAVASVELANSELSQRNAEVRQAEAARGEKQALLQLQRTRYERIAGLVKEGVIGAEKLDEPKFAMDAAESALSSVEADIIAANAAVAAAKANIQKALADKERAEAEVDVAKASVSLLKTQAGYLTIKAPYNGLIRKRMIDRGTFVEPADSNSGADPLFEIIRIDKVRVCVAVPSSKAAGITLDKDTVFHTIGGLPGVRLPGTISLSARSFNSDTRMMPIEIHFDNPVPVTQSNSKITIMLQPGMFGTVRVIVNTWDKDNLLPVVPSTAVATDENKQRYVMVVENGTCKKTPVDALVFNDAENIGIKSGVSIGAVVVREGVADLKDGQKISPESP